MECVLKADGCIQFDHSSEGIRPAEQAHLYSKTLPQYEASVTSRPSTPNIKLRPTVDLRRPIYPSHLNPPHGKRSSETKQKERVETYPFRHARHVTKMTDIPTIPCSHSGQIANPIPAACYLVSFPFHLSQSLGFLRC